MVDTIGVGGATWVRNWSRWGYKVATIGVGGATRWTQLEWVGLHGSTTGVGGATWVHNWSRWGYMGPQLE